MPTRLLLEGTDIRALLQQVHDEHGPSARIVHAERIRSGGVAGFFARQRYEVAVELDVPGLDDPPAPDPFEGPAAASGTAACDLLVDAAAREDQHRSTVVSAGTDEPDAAMAAPALEPPLAATDVVAATAPAVDVVARPMSGRAPGSPPRADAVAARRTLVAVGPTLTALPTPSTDGVPIEPPRVPRRPGDVLVLLGDAIPAYAAARRLATDARIPSSRVSVVSAEPSIVGLPATRRIADVVSARMHGAQLATGSAPAVVVVDAPITLVLDADGRDWVAEVVAALGGSTTWAVVDATRRAEDLRRWLACLPDVAALAVHGAAASSDAAAVLALGLPVATSDDPALLAPARAATAGTDAVARGRRVR